MDEGQVAQEVQRNDGLRVHDLNGARHHLDGPQILLQFLSHTIYTSG